MKNPTTDDKTIYLSSEQAEQTIKMYLGCSPHDIASLLNRAVECLNWLSVLFQCIQDANSGTNRATSYFNIETLSSLGAYIASDYETNIIGQHADEIQKNVNDAEEDANRRFPVKFPILKAQS
jgi:hypothetical protein